MAQLKFWLKVKKGLKYSSIKMTIKKTLICESRVAEDENVTKDLDLLAHGLIKKFERLQILNKKDINENSTNLKNSTNPSQLLTIFLQI